MEQQIKRKVGRPVKGVIKTNMTLQTEKRKTLEEYAKKHNKTMSLVVEELIEKYLTNQ